MGSASASATDGPHEYDWGLDQPPVMTEAQERIVAEIMATRGSAAPGLRHAVVPIEAIQGLALERDLRAVTERRQNYLQRAAREWARRGGEPALLLDVIADLVMALNTAGETELAASAAMLMGAAPEDLLVGALRLDRRLIGELRRPEAAQRFSQELERQLVRLTDAYAPTTLERLDILAAQRLAREYFIRAQMDIVRRRAKSVRRWSRLPTEDVIQSGNEGLVQAVDKYDHRFGVPFGAYAYQWVRTSIQRAEAAATLVPLPYRLEAVRGPVRRAVGRAASDGTRIDAAAIGAELDLAASDIEAVARADDLLVSLDGDESEALVERIASDTPTPAESLDETERKVAIRAAVNACAPREREILTSFYGVGRQERRVAEIARGLGLTTQRVYQLRNAELRRLRRPAVAKLLIEHA